MNRDLELLIRLPQCFGKDVVRQTLTIDRDPAGDHLAHQVVEFSPDVREHRILAYEDTHVELQLVAHDSLGNASRALRLNIQSRESAALGYDGEMKLLSVDEFNNGTAAADAVKPKIADVADAKAVGDIADAKTIGDVADADSDAGGVAGEAVESDDV